MILGAATLAWAGATTSVAVWAWLRSGGRRRAARAGASPTALMLRPCAGREPGLAAALASCAQAPEGMPIRLLVASADDPAFPVVLDAMAALTSGGRDAAVVVTGARGPNRKADQLHRALQGEAHPHDVVIVADSDVVLSREGVEALVGSLAQGGADAAWAAPVEVSASTRADRASACLLDGSLHSFGLLSALDPAGMVGKLFAIRRDALEAVGGFGALIDRLGEDMELARRLRAAGRRASCVAVPACSVARGRAWSAAVKRYARWISVIRAQRPALLASYPLLFAAAPLQLALALTAVAHERSVGVVAILLVCAGRWLTAIFARRRSCRPIHGLVLWPWVADLMLLTSFVLALGSRTVRWRGSSLRVERGGVLVEAGS